MNITTGPEFIPNNREEGLVLATHLPGVADELGEHRLDWTDLDDGTPERPIWIHLDRTKDRAQQWIREEAGLSPLVVEALLAEETRPTFQPYGDGFLVILRGVNMNPGAEPDELIAIRFWVEPHRVITLRQFKFQTLVELRTRAQRTEGPKTPGSFLAAVAHGLAVRMGLSVRNLEDMVDDIEDAMLDQTSDNAAHRSLLSQIRRQAISIRRYLVPQRDTVRELASNASRLLSPQDVAELRITADQVARVSEALEEIRDRAAVTQDEMRARHEARMSRTLYLLTLVATVALPLGLLTGLLGINVGGIPLADSGSGFVLVCVALLIVAVVEVILLRLLRWI